MNSKTYRYLAIAACAFLLNTVKLNAQVQNDHLRCGVADAMKELFKLHPELQAQNEELMQNSRQNFQQFKLSNPISTQSGGPPTYIIPVVFHIIHKYGVENISDAQVQDEMDVLNRDYRLANSDTNQVTPTFKALYADTKIEFRLATVDPDGNCTNGIDRVYSPHLTIDADDVSKLNDWPRNKYLNVWVVTNIGTTGMYAGYAYFPSTVTGIGFTIDGVIIDQDYIGRIGTGTLQHSRALTHEIGHFLNLEHPWGNNNSPGVACGDDGIADTPVTKGWDLICNLTTNYICNNPTISPVCNFDSVRPTSNTIIGNSVLNSTGLSISNFSAVGVGIHPTDSFRFVYPGWDLGGAPINADSTYALLTGSMNTAKYYQFTVSPITPYCMWLNKISFNVQRDSTGPRTYAIRSSVDGFGSNIATDTIAPSNANLSIRGGNVFFFLHDTTINQNGTTINLLGPNFTSQRGPITFRIYAWNAEDALGDFSIDNVAINGTTGIYENVQNYMEYSYCSVMFTIDQVIAQHQTLQSNISYRDNLPTYANHIATGTDSVTLTTAVNPYVFPAILPHLPVCKPVADLSANKFYICQGGTITFTDQSWRAPITGRTWTFANGTPSTSTQASPTITFNTWGWQDIKIVATSGAGSDSITKHNYVFVAPPWYDHFGAFSEGFENNDFPSGLWIVENMENSYPTWQQTSSTAYNGTRCVAMDAYGTQRNLVDAFITPSYDLTTCSNAVLNFQYSCATAATINTNVTEVLKVYVSTNCGQTWVNRKTITGAALANAGYSPTAFMPHSQSLWVNCAVNLFASDMAPNVRFRFEYTSGLYSNNIYIDNINLSATVGINEVNNYFFDLNVYPNPSGSNNTINIGYTLSSQENIKVSLVDMIGREVVVVNNEIEQAGEKLVTIDKNALDLIAGVYLVKITNGTSYTTRKLVITN